MVVNPAGCRQLLTSFTQAVNTKMLAEIQLKYRMKRDDPLRKVMSREIKSTVEIVYNDGQGN